MTFSPSHALTLAAEAEESLDANARGDWPAPAPDVRALASVAEMEACREELAVMHREYASLESHHARVVAQRNSDFDALTKLIAETVGDKDDREAAEMDELDEFDPWHALRTYTADRDRLRVLLAECCDIASDIATNGDHRFRSDIDKSMDRIAEIRREVSK
jgi:hypothetical protein